MTEVSEPVAVPQSDASQAAATSDSATVEPTTPRVGTNVAPESVENLGDPALDGFQKIAAQRRERIGEEPVEIPFGSTGTIRLHRSMPAGFTFDAIEAEVDPHAVKRMLKSAIIEEDQEKLEAILKLPPNNPEGIDGRYLVEFMQALSAFYAGRPLAD